MFFLWGPKPRQSNTYENHLDNDWARQEQSEKRATYTTPANCTTYMLLLLKYYRRSGGRAVHGASCALRVCKVANMTLYIHTDTAIALSAWDENVLLGARAKDPATMLLFTLMAALIIAFTGEYYMTTGWWWQQLPQHVFPPAMPCHFPLILLFDGRTHTHTRLVYSCPESQSSNQIYTIWLGTEYFWQKCARPSRRSTAKKLLFSLWENWTVWSPWRTSTEYQLQLNCGHDSNFVCQNKLMSQQCVCVLFASVLDQLGHTWLDCGWWTHSHAKFDTQITQLLRCECGIMALKWGMGKSSKPNVVAVFCIEWQYTLLCRAEWARADIAWNEFIAEPHTPQTWTELFVQQQQQKMLMIFVCLLCGCANWKSVQTNHTNSIMCVHVHVQQHHQPGIICLHTNK